jgi:hypothetical protein
VAYFQSFNSVAVLHAKPMATKALPRVAPLVREKGFDAVKESRKWKAAVSRKIRGMTTAQMLAYFNCVRTESRTRKLVAHAG